MTAAGTGRSHTWRRRPRRPLRELRAPGTPRLWRSYGQKSSGIGIQVQCSQGEEMLKPWFPWAGAGLLSPIILLIADACVRAHTHTSPPPAYLKYQQIFFHKFRYQGYKFGFPPDTCLAAPCASLQTPAPHLFLLAPTERKLHSSLLVTLTCLSSHTWLSTTCPTQKGRAPLGLFPVGCKD